MATTSERPRPSVGGLGLAARGLAGAATRAIGRLGVAVPVIVVAAVLATLLIGQLSANRWSLLGLIQFGRDFVSVTHPPPGAPRLSPAGYDGQFYWLAAQDPFLLHPSSLADLGRYHADFLQRLGYPLLTALLAAGQRSLLPAAMLAVGVLSVLGLTLAVALDLRARDRSVWWALAVGLTPGLLMPVLRDLSDPLAAAALLGGLLAWEARRPWSAGLLLGLAALTREPMIVGVAGVGAEVLARAVRVRRDVPALRGLARAAAPALIVPAVLFGAWQLYIRLRYVPVGPAAGAGNLAPTPVLHPFAVFAQEARRVVGLGAPVMAGWELTYLGLVLCAIGISPLLLRRGIRALSVTAGLLAAMLPFVYFDDAWSLSRDGAPLLVVLVVAGLRVRSRTAVAVGLGAAALTPLIPAMLAGI